MPDIKDDKRMNRIIGRFFSAYRSSKYYFSHRNLHIRLRSINVDRPIFILGVQGGGLTIIAKALQRHKDVIFCKGNNVHWDAAENEMQNYIFDMPEELSLFNNMKFNDKYKTTLFRYWTYALDETINLYRLNPDYIDYDLREKFVRVINKIIRSYAHDLKKCRFIDKSQMFTINILPIYKMLKEYNPYFILVTRNPYAMCKRVVDKYYENPDEHDFSFSHETNLRLCCQHWRNSYTYAIEDGKVVENFKIVKFEDFLISPYDFLKDLCDYVGLDFDTRIVPGPNQKSSVYCQMKSRWYPAKADANNKYIQQLTKDEIVIIKSECDDLIKQFGYDIV